MKCSIEFRDLFMTVPLVIRCNQNAFYAHRLCTQCFHRKKCCDNTFDGGVHKSTLITKNMIAISKNYLRLMLNVCSEEETQYLFIFTNGIPYKYMMHKKTSVD